MITTFLDPAALPSRTQEQEEFDLKMGEYMRNLPVHTRQMNAALEAVYGMQAGGAYAFMYTFSSATTNVTPASGRIALDNAAQNSATAMRTHWLTAGGVDVDALYASLAAGTSAVKGSVRLVKAGDPSKWLLFDITSVSSRSSSGVARNIFLAPLAWSDPSPFANGDAVMAFFDRAGDRGTGMAAEVYLDGVTITSGVVNVDYLNTFTTEYDTYRIDLTDMRVSGTGGLAFQFAIGGAVVSSTDYQGPVGHKVTSTALYPRFDLGQAPGANNPSGGLSQTLHVRNANGSSSKGLGIYGVESISNIWAVSGEARFIRGERVTGFRLFGLENRQVTGGTVSIFGRKKSNV